MNKTITYIKFNDYFIHQRLHLTKK